MMSIKARHLGLTLLAAGTLWLSGCGFEPLYAGPSGYQNLAGMQVTTGSDRIDFLVQDAISDFVGPGQSRYRLSVETDIRESGAGLSASGVATRISLNARVEYQLTGSAEPMTGRLEERVTYDTPSTPYGLISARSDGEARLAQLIAEAVIEDVSLKLRTDEDDTPSR